MRQIIISLALIVPILMSGKNYLREGLKWSPISGGMCAPAVERVNANSKTYYTTLKQHINDENESVLGLYDEATDSVGNVVVSNFLTAMKVDGDKVYFKPTIPGINDWLLMYDFGLTPGEGCYIYDAWTTRTIATSYTNFPDKHYVKCVGLEIHPDYPELDVMFMLISAEGYNDTGVMRTKVWLKGLFDMRGISDNIPDDISGGVTTFIREIWQDDQPLFIFSEEAIGTLIEKSDHYEAGLHSLETAPLSIRIDGMTLTLTNTRSTEQARIYTEQGSLVGSTTLMAGTPARFQLPAPGIYIVNIGTISRKVLAQ